MNISINTVSLLPMLPIVRLHVLEINTEHELREFDLLAEINDAGLNTEFTDNRMSFLRRSIKGMRVEARGINQSLYN